MKHIKVHSSPLPSELPGPAPFYLVLTVGDPVTGSFNEIVRGIRDGQIEDIEWILEIIPREGVCHDVTQTIAQAVHALIESQGYPVSMALAGWLDNWLGLSVDREAAFRELAAAE